MAATFQRNDFGPGFVPGKVNADPSAASYAMRRRWFTSSVTPKSSTASKNDAHTDESVPSADDRK